MLTSRLVFSKKGERKMKYGLSKGTQRKMEHQSDLFGGLILYGVPFFILSQIGNVVVDCIASLW